MDTTIRNSAGISANGNAETEPSVKLLQKAGEKFFVDFCGDKLAYANKITGELTEVEVFIGVLPSQYIFVKVAPLQKREDNPAFWRAQHPRNRQASSG